MSKYLEINKYLIDTSRINWLCLGSGDIYISFHDGDKVSLRFSNKEKLEAEEAYKILKEKLNG